MFVPSLAVGAAGGRLAGQLVAAAVHWAGSKLPVSLTAYSVIGECVVEDRQHGQGRWRPKVAVALPVLPPWRLAHCSTQLP